jgi:predicted XRE-type DNA-binding protein
LEDTPEAAERMKLRSELMIAREQQVTAKSWTGEEAAQRMGVSASRMSDLIKGAIDLFSLDDLVSMLVEAGLRLHITVSEADAPAQQA